MAGNNHKLKYNITMRGSAGEVILESERADISDTIPFRNSMVNHAIELYNKMVELEPKEGAVRIPTREQLLGKGD